MSLLPCDRDPLALRVVDDDGYWGIDALGEHVEGRRIKLLAGMLLVDPRVSQQGRLRQTVVFEGRPCEVTFLASTNPTPDGESITMKLNEKHWGPSGDGDPASDADTRVLGDRVVMFRKRGGRPTR